MVSRRKEVGVWGGLSVEAVPATAHTSRLLLYEFAQPLVSSYLLYWGPSLICYTSKSLSDYLCIPPPTSMLKSGL